MGGGHANVAAMSAFVGKAKNICSRCVFPVLTLFRARNFDYSTEARSDAGYE